ncbi:ADP-ribose pyrophosphatase YjhB (NUDIX family) [Geomicrobium halophilum]|uniref:ADP-ribose pyrophosphatase YjhB (NUDIX family) n=1 Tax=Geomicrobium halophilum TaxID=549000 RepID=A0A841PPK5_9BACL|nr:NUDIX hydrolase [Geomicrobium halophilum]MBB6449744.1 ADP-ribose pyrophosphatase YjhB (NUDIX family) [Geomicrobium halophilum]
MEHKWLEWAKQLQSIAQSGLAYSTDEFDIERFKLIRNISVEMIAEKSDISEEKVSEIFASETGYATPKVDVRSVVFNDNQILMVKEKKNGYWSLPGGWADIGLTASEVAVQEVKEEAGFDVVPKKLLAVLDMKCHSHPPSLHHIYKIFIQCEIVGGEPTKGMETSAVEFFDEHRLPPLSISRNTEPQIKMSFKKWRDANEDADFD